MCWPPLIDRVDPVMKPPSSDTRNNTPRAISWASPTEPLPMIRDPRVAFDMLFGAGGTAEDRALRRRTNASILDWITEEVAYMRRQLGPNVWSDHFPLEVELVVQFLGANDVDEAPSALVGQ